MEKIPLVSILMPVYNGSEYLRPAINSILNQTFDNFELIIVNDGSTDDSLAIIETYADTRIVILNQENQGVARSLNNGLRIAKGKYVRRHDADDISTPDSIEIQMNFLEQNPNYAMVCAQQAFMTSNGKIAPKFKVPNSKYFEGQIKKDLSFDDFSNDRSSPVVHGTACFHRQIVLNLGSYRTEFIVSEDNDLWLRILEKHRIAVLNRCIYYMRIHPNSATHRHASKISFFRKILIDYSLERREKGSDPIMRGEGIQMPSFDSIKPEEKSTFAAGKNFREDLRYMYSLVSNAKDTKLMSSMFWTILKDGWKDKRTYKLLLFPILGDKLVQKGVKLKKTMR